MTVREILHELEPFKPITRETLYNYIRRLKIKPVGKMRQIPVRYPDDTGRRVLRSLGFKPHRINGRKLKEAA